METLREVEANLKDILQKGTEIQLLTFTELQNLMNQN